MVGTPGNAVGMWVCWALGGTSLVDVAAQLTAGTLHIPAGAQTCVFIKPLFVLLSAGINEILHHFSSPSKKFFLKLHNGVPSS